MIIFRCYVVLTSDVVFLLCEACALQMTDIICNLSDSIMTLNSSLVYNDNNLKFKNSNYFSLGVLVLT